MVGLPSITRSCNVRDVGPIPLNPVPKDNITIVSKEVAPIRANQFLADIHFNFTYMKEGVEEEIQRFYIWFRPSVAPADENFTETLQTIPPQSRSATVSRDVQSADGRIGVYLQVRCST